MPGVLAFGGDTGRVVHPPEVRVGEPVTLQVTTFGRCDEDYGIGGPAETLVSVEGLEAEVRPMDLLNPVQCPPGSVCACVGLLRKFRHEASITPQQPGTMRVRIFGRGLKVGQSNAARGDPIVREVTIDVRPSGS